jgi:hypothetical protein
MAWAAPAECAAAAAADVCGAGGRGGAPVGQQPGWALGGGAERAAGHAWGAPGALRGGGGGVGAAQKHPPAPPGPGRAGRGRPPGPPPPPPRRPPPPPPGRHYSSQPAPACTARQGRAVIAPSHIVLRHAALRALLLPVGRGARAGAGFGAAQAGGSCQAAGGGGDASAGREG